MSNAIQVIGMIVAVFSVLYTTYNKVLAKSSIKQATATPTGALILSIGIVIIGFSLIISQTTTKNTIDGIVFVITGVALAISAKMWRTNVLRKRH